jgi:integral membrane protein
MRNAWIRYRIMAWIVGTLLVVLVCVGLPLKYLGDNPTVVTWTAIPHGYLYMILLITAVDLGLRAKWSWTRLILIALAGTVPFLSFVAERSATKNIRSKLAAQAEAAEPAATPSAP